MYHFNQTLGCAWETAVGIALLGDLALIAPVIFWRRRAAYLAFWSLVFFALIGALWYGDRNRQHLLSLFTEISISGNPGMENLVAVSSFSTLTLSFQRFRNLVDDPPPRPVAQLIGNRSGEWNAEERAVNGLPWETMSGNVINRWGFTLCLHGEQDRGQRELVRLQFWYLRVPNWFLALIFAITPIYWAYRNTRWGQRGFRRRNRLCEFCGYSLQGLVPREGGSIVCPECGKTAPARDGTQTAMSLPASGNSTNTIENVAK